MKTYLVLLSLSFVLASCTTINLSQPGADDLYWVKSDIDPATAVEPAETPEIYQEDYWDGGSGTTATTESGDVIVNNFDGGFAPNNAFNWMGWDPYWGWGFGIGWQHPSYYSGWYNYGFCNGNNWYNPYWYHNPWFNGGWGSPGFCSPFNYPFGFNGNGGPVIWGNGNWSDGGGTGGFFYGPFTSISSNSGSNSSYNGQGQHLGRISPTTDITISDGIGKRPVLRPNYVERLNIQTLDNQGFENPANLSGRGLMNVPKPPAKPTPSIAKPQKPSGQNKPSWDKIDLPPFKAPEAKPTPSGEPSHSPSTGPERWSPPPSGGGGAGKSGGSRGGGGRPPRQ